MATLPTFTTPVLTGYDRRTLKGHVVAHTFPNGDEHRVSLTVSHDKERKAFTAYLTRYTRKADDGGPFTVETCSPMEDCVRIANRPCARYSLKALEAAFGSTLPIASILLETKLAHLLATPTAAN